MSDIVSAPEAQGPDRDGKVRTPRGKGAPTKKPGAPPLPSIAPILGDRARRDDPPHDYAASRSPPVSGRLSERALMQHDQRYPSADAQAKRSKQEEISDRLVGELIRVLRSLKEQDQIDEIAIEKLETAKSQSAQDVAKLARSLQQQFVERHTAPVQSMEEGEDGNADQQTEAQVAFLDKKITKLREKLRKKGLEVIQLTQEPAAEAPSGTRTSLVAEVGMLRAEVSSLNAEVKAAREQIGKRQRQASPERPEATIQEAQESLDAMRQKVVEAQTKMASLIREKEDAEASAELAKKLVKNVESRLRDAVISRESEQADLIAEQKTLHRRLETQNRRITELERQESHLKKFEALKDNFEALESQLAKEQHAAKQVEARAAELETAAAQPTAPPADQPDAMSSAMTMLSVSEEGTSKQVGEHEEKPLPPPVAPEVEVILAAVYCEAADRVSGTAEASSVAATQDVGAIDPATEYEESLEFQQKCDAAMQERQAEQIQLAAKKTLLANLTEHMQKQIKDMERQLQDTEESRNAGLENLQRQHQDQKNAQQNQHQEIHQKMLDKSNQDKAQKTGRIQAEINTTIESELKKFKEFKAEVEQTTKQLELRASHLSTELLRAKHDTELVRLQREFRGALWLTVRRATYKRGELLCCLSEALKLPIKRLRIIEDDAPLDVAAPTEAPPVAAPKAPTLNLELSEEVKPQAPPLKRTNPFKRTLKGKKKVDGAEDEEEDPLTQTAVWPSQDDSKNGSKAMVVPEATGAATSGIKPALGAHDADHQRIFLEVIEDPAMDKAMGTSRFGIVTRLAGLISRGDPRIEELAVTKMEVACGETSLPSQWPSQMAKAIDRRGRNLAGRNLVVTAFQLVDPFIVKFVAYDEEDGSDFVLHLYENDVRTLVGTALLDPAKMREMVEAIVGTLRIIHKDKQPLLVAVQEFQAPPSVSNFIDPLMSATALMSTEHRKWQRKLAQRRPSNASLHSVPEMTTALEVVPTMGSTMLQLSQAGTLVLDESASGESKGTLAVPDAFFFGAMIAQSTFQASRPESESCQLAFEDLLMLNGHMILFWIQKGINSGNIQLLLQEAGKCKPFNITMPGAGAEKQQRIYAQLCDFGDLELMLMVEEVAVPPVLVVRIVQGNSAFPATWQESEEQVFCFARQDLSLISEGSSELSYPSQRRAQLLQFLHQVPTAAKSILEGTNSALTGTGGKAYKYGVAGKERDGKIVFDPNLTQIASPATTEKAKGEATGKTKQKLIAKCGRRIFYMGESKLFVLRVFQRTEPYSYYVVNCFELGTCREWDLLIDNSDLFKCLKNRTSFTDVASQRTACMELIHRCAFSTVGGTQTLTLKKVTGDLAEIRKIADNESAKVSAEKTGTVGTSQLPGASTAPGGTLSMTKAFESIGAADIERACREMTGAAGAKPSGTVLTGGHFVDLRHQGRKSAGEYYRAKVHSSMRRFGSLDIVFTVEVTPGNSSHILCAYHPQTMTLYELCAATGDDTQPQKISMEHVDFAGLSLVFAITEVAFPHSVQFLVLDPASGREFRCSMKDETIFAMVPRSQREFYSKCTEQFLRYGVIGDGGSGQDGFQDTDLGATSIDLDSTVVPVIRLPFQPVSSAVETDTIPIYSTSHSVFVEDSEEPKEIRIFLSKSSASEEFTLGLEDCDAERGSMHMINLCDKCHASPFGLHSEIHRCSGLNLAVLAFVDSSPRAVRVAVADPNGWKFQAVILDCGDSKHPVPYLDASPVRAKLLDTFLANFSTKPSEPLMKATLSPPSRPSSQPTTPGEVKISKLIHRTTHKLHSGQPVILSVIREMISDNSLRFRVLMYNPMSAKENSLLLMNPLLDKVLALAGFGDSRTVTVEEIDRRKEEISTQILACTYVHPDGTEIEFRTSTQAQRYNAQCRRTSASNSQFSLKASAVTGEPAFNATEGPSATGLATTVDAAEVADPEFLEQVVQESSNIRVEVFTHEDARDNISFGTNFRVAITCIKSGKSSSFVVHETTLDPWLKECDAKYLLNASREEDLILCIARHAYLTDADELAFVPIDVRSEPRYAPPQLVRSKRQVA